MAILRRREEPRPPAAPPVRRDARPGLTCSRRDDAAAGCVLRIEGALDAQTAPEVRALFDAVASEERVTLELDGLEAIDSSGVGAIVSLFKRVKASGGVLVLAGVRGQPLDVCKLLKLDRVFSL